MASGKRATRNNSASQETLSMDEKLDLLINEVTQIKIDNRECLNEISSVKEEFKRFEMEINKTFDTCFNDISKCQQDIKVNTTTVSACVNNIDQLKNDNLALKKSVGELKKRLSAAEQYSRANCLEITGVPEIPNENVIYLVKRLAVALNFKLEDSMIDAVHRLAKNPNKPDDPRGIIIKFCSRIDMEEMRKKSRVKKFVSATELGFDSERKVYVNLSLSRETRILWAEVQNFRKRNNYKFAWITNAGKIFLRKGQGQPAIHVSEVLDLTKLQ